MKNEIVPAPWVGFTGFRGTAATAPPYAWLIQHELAETGGYVREGRRWQRASTAAVIALAAAPVRAVFNPMIARITGDAAMAQGWCADV